jgi:hypothetical protein
MRRGPERIRTAVEAFAELYLATRSQDLIKNLPVGCENKAIKVKLKF